MYATCKPSFALPHDLYFDRSHVPNGVSCFFCFVYNNTKYKISWLFGRLVKVTRHEENTQHTTFVVYWLYRN